MLSRLFLVNQAALLDGQFLDLLPPFDDGGMASEIGIGRCDVSEALMVAVIVVVIDEGLDLFFEITG